MDPRLSRQVVRQGALLREPETAGDCAPIRLALVTGVRLFREGLARLLADRIACFAVDTSRPDDALIADIAEIQPDVVLVDVAVIRGGVARRLRERVSGARMVAFAVAESEEDVLACVELGVAGLVGRDASVDELLMAVDGARRGELHCSPRVAGVMLGRLASLARPPVHGMRLTMRQQQILSLLEQGLTNKEMAHHMGIRESTVKNHVHGLLSRLNIRHRWQAMAAVRR